MPQLEWNEIDLLDYFEVEPTVLDEVVSHSYEVERNGLRLLLTVWQLESVVQVTLFRSESEAEIFTFAAYARGPVRRIDDQRGKFIEIGDCIIAPNRFWYIEAGDVFNKGKYPASITIEIEVRPEIRIAFVPDQSLT